MVKEPTTGRTAGVIMDSGADVRCMASVHVFGPTEDPTKVVTTTTRNMVTAFSVGQMAAASRVSGKTASSMVLAVSGHPEPSSHAKVFGSMGSVLSGHREGIREIPRLSWPPCKAMANADSLAEPEIGCKSRFLAC